ncbi:MAG: lipoate--protein ligase family protein [Planctomycetes bacterium]|nr:lipoate--protein ligase family protein [Planctomycetota bacterium]
MQFLDLTLPSAVANLALDEALLLEAEAGRGGEMLRLWEWSHPAVVLGSGCVLREDVDEDACAADGVPVLRRSSGGGTVLLGRGCLLFSLVLAFDRSPALATVRPSYGYILERLCEALADIVPGIRQGGISDLAARGRKFSGNAQQRKRRFLLHHGTLLYDFDLALIGRYLRRPARQPEYRAGRDHLDFVRNLPCPAEELRNRLCIAWQAEERSSWPEEAVAELVRSKYSTAEWVRRR